MHRNCGLILKSSVRGGLQRGKHTNEHLLGKHLMNREHKEQWKQVSVEEAREIAQEPGSYVWWRPDTEDDNYALVYVS
jgi:hypothetical protein